MGNRFPKLAVLALWLAPIVAVLLPATAAAQSNVRVTLGNTFNRKNLPFRPTGQAPRSINRADCLADDVLTFTANVTSINTYQLEVWAGTGSSNCLEATARGVAAKQCWLVYRDLPSSAVWPIDIRAQTIVAQRYPDTDSTDTGSGGTSSGGAGGASSSGGTSSGGSGGTTSGSSGGLVEGTIADCEGNNDPAVQLTLYFMFVQANQVVGTHATWTQTGFDISPPSAPSGIAAEPGENRVLLSWSATPPSDLLEWRFYCDPPPGELADGGVSTQSYDIGTARQAQQATGGVPGSGGTPGSGGDLGAGGLGSGGDLGAGGLGSGGDLGAGGLGSGGDLGAGGLGSGGDLGAGGAGSGGVLGAGGVAAGGTSSGGSLTDGGLGVGGATGGASAGSGGTTGSSQVCEGQGTVLVPGTTPDERYRCGTSTGTLAREGSADGLQNNIKYSIGVVGVDRYGNVGKLSELQCGEPKLHTDFFELYKKRGGAGGGGFCSISRDGSLGPALGTGMLALIGLGLLRRRKRN